MKKQILFLTFFVAAIFAGTNAFGQNVEPDYMDAAPASCPIPTPLTCGDALNPLAPMAGQLYNYEISHTGGVNAKVHWFVTNDPAILAAEAPTANIEPDDGTSPYMLDAEDATYNIAHNNASPITTTDIDISWKAFDGITNAVFLVAFVEDEVECTNNLEVWKIEPQYSFILEIAGVEDDGTVHTADNASECVSPVLSATYNLGALDMDYGQNYIYYVISAANWLHSWQPTFTVDGAGTSSTVTTSANVEWAYSDEADGASAVWNAATAPVLAAHYTTLVQNDAIGPDGACIVARVLVDHANNPIETANESVILGVDGDMYNLATTSHDGTYLDLDEPVSGTDCVTTVTDQATYELTPRPNITEVTPAPVTFVPKN